MKRRSIKRGATAVEVAICLPILLMFLFGSYEMARANFLIHAAESAAYEGARVGIIPGATPQKIETAVDFVMRSCGASEYTVNVTPNEIREDTERIEVEVLVPMKENTTFTFRFLEDPTFKGKCAMNRERL